MAGSGGGRAVRWLFGEEGGIAAESELQIMVVAAAVLTSGTLLMSPLIADLATVFDVSEARAGLIIVLFTAPSIVLIPVMGTLADRVGRKKVFVPGLLVFGVAGSAVGIVQSFDVAIALRIVQAVGFAAAMPITIAALGDLYADGRERTAQGMRTAGINVVSMGAPFLGGVLFLVSWRLPFLVYLLAIPFAAWAWVTLPEIEPNAERSLRDYLDSLAVLISRPVMALVLASFIVRFVLLFSFLTYVSVLAAREVGLAVVAVGSIVSIKGLIAFVAATQSGRLTARIDPILLVVAAFLIDGAGLALMGLAPSIPTLVVGTVLLGIGDGAMSPTQKSLVNERAPLELRGGAVSVASTFQNIGKVTGPLLLAALLVPAGAAGAFVIMGVTGGLLGAGLLVGARLAEAS